MKYDIESICRQIEGLTNRGIKGQPDGQSSSLNLLLD